jgi:hypothetical protein
MTATTKSLVRVDEDLLHKLRDRVAHAEVFAQATARAIEEAFDLLGELRHFSGEEDENGSLILP